MTLARNKMNEDRTLRKWLGKPLLSCMFLLGVWLTLWIYFAAADQVVYSTTSLEREDGTLTVLKLESSRASTRVGGVAYQLKPGDKDPGTHLGDRRLSIDGREIRIPSSGIVGILPDGAEVDLVSLDASDLVRDEDWVYGPLPLLGSAFPALGSKPVEDLTEQGWGKVELAIRAAQSE